MLYKLDLHIHTKASKCFKGGDMDNAAVNRAIIQQAKNNGLDLIAVTDHYTLKNYPDIKALGSKENINVLPGIELSLKTSSLEKLSLIIIFSDENDLKNLEKKLLSELNVPDNEPGNGKFLINKKPAEVIKILRKYDCMIISAHQDKNEERMLLIPILIKHGINLFDMRYPDREEIFMERYSRYNIIPLTFSDCHEISNVGKYFMKLSLKEPSYNGFKDHLESILRANHED